MMEDEAIAKLVDTLELRNYKKGEKIIAQGEEGKEFYILQKGSAVVTGIKGGEEQEYMRYHGGECFGELALLRNATRFATVTALSRCEVLALRKRPFERLLG